MKKMSASLLALALPLSLATGHVSAQALTGCAAKKADVQTQLEQARAHGNKAQESKLKIAQKQLETNCTDEGLRREREADIKKKQEKVDARKADLEKARAKGKSRKIAQQEKKLKDAEDELKAAQEKLDQ